MSPFTFGISGRGFEILDLNKNQDQETYWLYFPRSFTFALLNFIYFVNLKHFPTIFALSIRGLGAKTKIGSSLVIMSIVGGAIFPVIMGWVSDQSSIQTAYIVPAFCFLVVLYFAIKNSSVKNVTLGVSH